MGLIAVVYILLPFCFIVRTNRQNYTDAANHFIPETTVSMSKYLQHFTTARSSSSVISNINGNTGVIYSGKRDTGTPHFLE